MRTVFDELEGLLGKDEIAKIKNNAGLSRRLEKSDELFGMYDEADDTPTDPPVRRTESRTDDDDPPARRREPAGDQTLADLTKTLQGITAKLGDVPTKKDLEETIKTEGDKLFQNVLSRALEQGDELASVRDRHREEFNERLDTKGFKDWTNEQVTGGKKFSSITEAYESYTGTRRTDALVDQKVREKLKERAANNQGNLVPGVTPPSSKSPISTFMKRGRETDAGGGTALDRAGSALDSLLASKSSEA